MRHRSFALVAAVFLAAPASAQVRYDVGSPVLRDIWVDPSGSDSDTGESRDRALRTVIEAWARVPRGAPLSGTGYRLMLAAGRYGEDVVPNWWEDRQGTRGAPVMIVSADGPGRAVLPNLEIASCTHLYLMGLRIEAAGGDALHVQASRHVLVREVTIVGLGDVRNYEGPQEAMKVNQSQHVYVEDCDVSGGHDNAIDFVAVQYGHIVRSRIHRSVSWALYLKGGSAYYLVEGNELYDAGEGGFAAGQGTGFEFMVSPWIHHEAYDIRFVNNVVHDVEGAGIAANGAYDALFAFNTLYRVGRRSHAIEVRHGNRTCDGDVARCRELLAEGGWGTTQVGGDEPIPARNVYIVNNLVLNPDGYRSEWQHLTIDGPRAPSSGSNIPSPARVDDNLVLRGNLFWNGPADLPVGVEDADLEARLRAENTINAFEPRLVDPAGGDFRPVAGGNVFTAPTAALPAFPGGDQPRPPIAPAGELANAVPVDRAGAPRGTNPPPGAYSGTGGTVSTPPAPTARPDLAGVWLRLSATRQRVQGSVRWSIAGAVRVENRGQALAGASTVRVHLSADAALEASDRLLRTIEIPALAPGESRRVAWSVLLPRRVDPRGSRVLVALDALGVVVESDEGNGLLVSEPIR